MKHGGQRSGNAAGLAFTLVEVLVVLAVIAVLAALLLPALSQSKLSAHRIKCVNNLRQLGLATQMYWDDNDGRRFRFFAGRTNNGAIYWFGWLENGSEGDRRFEPAAGALYPYLQGRGVEVCPAFDYTAGNLKLKATGASYCYGYNLLLATNPAPVVRPAQTVLFADAAQVNTWQSPASASNPMLEEWYYVDASVRQPNGHFRHRHKANVVFCDGHVDLESPVPGSLDPRLPSQAVGRLRDEVLRLP